MPQPTVAELLARQFRDWEERGRGWLSFERPVELEPPFRAFTSHRLPHRRVLDDGRRRSLIGVLVDLVSPPKPPNSAPTEDPEPPQPRLLVDDDGLRFFTIAIPREEKASAESATSFLLALRGLTMPAAFEVIGTAEGVSLQVAVRSLDAALLRAAVRSHCPGLVLAPAADRFARYLEPYETSAACVLHLGFGREFMLPFDVPTRLEPDPLAALVGALDDIEGESDCAAFQILFEPAENPWAESIYRAVTADDGGDFFSDAPEFCRAAKQKATEPLFAVVLRLVISGNDPNTVDNRLRRLTAALGQFEAGEGNHFMILNEDEAGHPVYRRDVLLRQSHWTGMLWSLSELRAFVHPPGPSIRSPRFLPRSAKASSPAPAADDVGMFLGINHHAGRVTPVRLTLDRARRHVHLVGASGSGKSNLLLQLLLEDIREGGGIALLDPHGDLVDDLLARMPENRIEDVILFDPGDTDYPIGFNVLHAHTDLERTLLASDLVAIFRRLSTSWGDQMHAVLANAIQAILESSEGGTIADLRRFLVDREFRERFLASVNDEEIVYYWRKQFPLLRGQPQAPILTRLDAFLRPKLVRQMVVQRENRVDFRSVMDDGKIFLAKLALGAIGEENAALLGSFLIARFNQAAMSRQDVRAEDRRPFLVTVDECQHFVTPSMASILSGTRKYTVGLVLVHQDLTQLHLKDAEVYAALMANAGTRIAFRVGDADARALSDGFAHFGPEDLRSLERGEAICRFDRADHDFNLAVPLVAPIVEADAEARRARIIERSRAKYCQPPAARKVPCAIPAVTAVDASESPTRPHVDTAPPGKLTGERTATVTAAPSAHPAPERSPARRPSAETTPLGRGGAQHQYLQELVKRFGEAQGYRATIEKPTAHGGSVDVALEREDGSIAVEISVTSTTAYEGSNVAKCLAAGYGRVVVLASERRRLDAIGSHVRANLPDTERDRVAFLLPEEFLTFLTAQTAPPDSEVQVGGYKVKVKYTKPSDDEARARQRSVAAVVARSTKRFT